MKLQLNIKTSYRDCGNPTFAQMTLTDEHAASSYGRPVLVDAEGNVYGPADRIAAGNSQTAEAAVQWAAPEGCPADVAAFIDKFAF